MICFCLCTIVWASSSSLLELCFMLFWICWLKLNLKGVKRLLVDIDGYCKNELNGGNQVGIFISLRTVCQSQIWMTAVYCVCWVARV